MLEAFNFRAIIDFLPLFLQGLKGTVLLSLASLIGWMANRELGPERASRIQSWFGDFWWFGGLIGAGVALKILLT